VYITFDFYRDLSYYLNKISNSNFPTRTISFFKYNAEKCVPLILRT